MASSFLLAFFFSVRCAKVERVEGFIGRVCPATHQQAAYRQTLVWATLGVGVARGQKADLRKVKRLCVHRDENGVTVVTRRHILESVHILNLLQTAAICVQHARCEVEMERSHRSRYKSAFPRAREMPLPGISYTEGFEMFFVFFF